MYFDNLTLISLLVFLIAFGAFLYSCVYRSCLSDHADPDWRKDKRNERKRQ